MPAILEGFSLSHQQARCWTFQGCTTALRAQLVVSIVGELDVTALERSLGRVVERHEILRTTFQALPGLQQPVQVIAPSVGPIVTHVDVSGVTGVRDAELVDRLLTTDARGPCDLGRGALLRCVGIRWSPTRHALAIMLPSMCADHRTLQNIVGELAAEYAAAVGVRTGIAAADDEPLQYADFVEWQRSMPSSDDGASERFWRIQQTTSEAIHLPLAVSPTVPTFRPAELSRVVAESRTRSIRALTSRSRTSEAAFWIACWSAVLWRFSDCTDLPIARLYHGRRYPEMQTAMGPFANGLPIRCRGAWQTSFIDHMDEVHRTMTEADRWQDFYTPAATPGGGPQTGGAEWPLMFAVHDWPSPRRVAAVTFTTERQVCRGEPFLVKLTCCCGDRATRTELGFDARRVPRQVAEWLLDQLHRVADDAVAQPDRPVSAFHLRAAADGVPRGAIDDVTATGSLGTGWLPNHVDAQAARTPDAIAIDGPSGAITYQGLHRAVTRIAGDLRARGVGLESRVAVLLRRSPRLIAAMLGVLKAGGAYVPLEPTDPLDRIASCLDDADVTVGLVDAGVAVPARPAIDWLRIDDWPATGAHDAAVVEASLSGDHLAYVMYTSGSTGTPKGALITHAGLTNYLRWCVEAYGIASGEAAPLHSSPAVDLTVTSLFAPLLVGGAVTLAPDITAVQAVAAVVEQPRPLGILKLTPSHLQALTWQVAPDVVAGRARVLIVGGEALQAEALSPWRAASHELRIVNEYGPTETVVGSCAYEVPADLAPAGAVPIGRPIANTRVYVLDRFGDPVAPYSEGELFIGGAGVARGYLNRPALTAERFVPDPFGGRAGARLYRTGDRVRWNAGAQLVYIGRGDQQVKLRGHRIELGEVEAALRAQSHVRDAAAMIRQDQPDTTQLVAYLVADPSTRAPLEDLRAALRRTLPDYMLPDIVVWLDALPLTRSGKVDRRALPAPAHVLDPDRPVVRPSTAVEEVLAAIWADVLRLDEVGIHDNFFALGGDSIRAIQVRARAGERGLDITHEQIFEHQTIAALAATARFDAAPLRTEPLPPLALVADADRPRLPLEVEDAYPLAALQAGMVFHSEYVRDSAVFHDIHSFTLRGEPTLDVLQHALDDLTRRHPILRTAFELARHSRPLQLVYRHVVPPLGTTDLRAVAAADHRRVVDAWLDEERRRPFDWRTPPLVRFHVHLLSEHSFQFTMSFHHAMLDGWSAASLLTELFNRYRILLDDREAPPDAPLRCTYRDFIALEQQAEASPACREFWRDTLRTVSPTMLARAGTGSGDRTGAGRIGTVNVPLAKEVVDRLRRLSRDAALPLKSIALAAHAKVLAVETDQPRIMTGLVSNGRPEDVDGDRVLGLFLNTVPCVVPVGPRSWRQLAYEAFESERRLLPVRLYPLARLQREHGSGPLFDVAFNFMHYHVYDGVRAAPSVQVDGYWGYEETDVPLMANFYVDLQRGDLGLLLGYHPEVFSRDDVERLARRYTAVLTAMASSPDANHAATDLLTPPEREQIDRASAPRASAPWSPADRQSITTRLEACAAATPDAIGVSCGGASITYRELHARADALACALRARGVGADTPVAICLDRSPDLVIGLLGILKAGGAYVPLDPAYPPARLALVLEDAKPALVLTRDALVPRGAAIAVPTIRIDADWRTIEAASPRPSADVAAGQLAYIIYTSGSTGRPKGVMVPHGAVLNFMRGMEAIIGAMDGAVWFAVTSAAFDISVLELICPLAHGARIVIAAESATSEHAAALMRAEGVTHLQCTPSWAWRLLASDALATDALQPLSYMLVGGEALPATLAAELCARTSGRVLNMYGPTETTIWSSADVVADPTTITLGRPILNTQIAMLDSHGHLVPHGRSGEICIGGDGVVRGYVGRPGLTADRFRPDALAGVAGARVYRTGDWGRLLADDRVDYLGRRDTQVKLRGHRIELAEIEAALRRQPGVRDAVVMLREDTPGARRLVAYIVTASGAAWTSDTLQAGLRAQLPAPMIPSVVVAIDALPLTPNGKIDRRRLPAPGDERPALAVPYAPPRTEMEAVLARIWAEVLRVDRVGIHDSFFALGGHSLSATQVVARFRDALAVELPLRDLFEAPTIARLVPRLERHRAEGQAAAADLTLDQAFAEAAVDLDALLDELERLPDDEVQQLVDESASRRAADAARPVRQDTEP